MDISRNREGRWPTARASFSRRELLRAAVMLPAVRSLARPSIDDAAEEPGIAFSELTPKVTGIDFRHRSGGTGAKEMIETMGAGCALFDYNNDGFLDMYF